MQVVQVSVVTEEIVAAFARLIPQLSANTPPPERETLDRMIGSPNTALFVARDAARSGEIVGVLTLTLVRIPTALRAWIDDVVVDASARGRGVGEALCQAALQHAKTAGAVMVDLTSHPSREAANRLYQRMGFALRETNVYRFKL